jgi:hypothetical protein
MLKRIIHYAIAHYVARCHGAFHVQHLNVAPRVIVMMTEQQYQEWCKPPLTISATSIYSPADFAHAIRTELSKISRYGLN